MTDIDFDELDKAVNSLMTQHEMTSQQTEPAQLDTPSPSPATTSHDEGQTSRPSTTAPVLSPAIRRQGVRFMDVKPPTQGSRMRPVRQNPSEGPSRESVALEPQTSNITSPAQIHEEVVPASEAAPEYASYAPEAQDTTDAAELKPDFEGYSVEVPGDVAGKPSEEGEMNVAAEQFSSPAEEEQPVTTPEVSPEPADTPMQSPFLSDVEVDKRPLGAAMQELLGGDVIADEQPLTQTSEPVSTELHADMTMKEEVGPEEPVGPWPEEQVPDASLPPEPLPPEFSAEVLALESDDAPGIQEAVARVIATPVTPEATPGQTVQTDAMEHASVQPTESVTLSQTTPGDIPTQYAATAADAPEPSAIFDEAATEPQQLQHPEKKKSGWSVIIWIVLLLIIGVGGGIAGWYLLQ